MRLCVGAVTRRVVEEAAKLNVPQIVASRRQVDVGGGYTGLDQEQLVKIVRELSPRHQSDHTQVVRDHGGPGQGLHEDDGTESFDADVEAGFDGIHIDVCKLPRDQQFDALASLLDRYRRRGVAIEIGGERDDEDWLDQLMYITVDECGVVPSHRVIDLGGHIHADRQRGTPLPVAQVRERTLKLNRIGVKSKAHNMDWLGDRRRYRHVLDAFNVAPEYANIEVDAWLQTMSRQDGEQLLRLGHQSQAWTRWFDINEGTWFERARCGVRYILETPDARELIGRYDDGLVRRRIRDALRAG